MELTIRDWMVIIGALLILAVLVDAVRRVRSEKYSRVKVNLLDPQDEESTGAERAVDLHWLKELPNGGARVVRREDLLNAEGLGPGQSREELAPAPAPEVVPVAERAAPERPEETEEEVELVAGISTDEAGEGDLAPGNIDWLEDVAAEDALELNTRQAPAAPGKLPRGVDPEVFMLNVVSRSPNGFRGEDILHILLACDLRFGDMSFFHRHEFEAGRGAIQFSVANMMSPGVFDIDNMADFDTPGLVFFVTLPGPEDMMKAFDYMLETAQAVARNLEGDVLDESRSALTRQTMEHSRQKIRDLERRLLARAH